jgi:hypothetical protein
MLTQQLARGGHKGRGALRLQAHLSVGPAEQHKVAIARKIPGQKRPRARQALHHLTGRDLPQHRAVLAAAAEQAAAVGRKAQHRDRPAFVLQRPKRLLAAR